MPNREYYQKHKEEIKAKNKLYKQAHREQYNAYKKEYRRRNHDKIYAYQKQYREEHREELKEKANKYRAGIVDTVRAWRRDYYNSHRDACVEHAKKLVKTRKTIGDSGDKKCEKCGANNPQIHHLDYSDLTKIMWLCPKCHGEWHRFNEPKNSPYRNERWWNG